MPWIAGSKFIAERGMTGLTGNIYAGLHEFVDMMVLLHFLRDDDLFLDIGANVGSFSILASAVRGADTIAFEPDPESAKRFLQNVRLNDMQARVRLLQVAVGGANGTVNFSVGQDTMNQVVQDGSGSTRTVELRTLDSALDGRRPAMIKMDVEGYEKQALSGAEAVLAMDSLKIIELETVSDPISSILTSNGFSRGYYDPFTRELSREAGRYGSSNSIYVRDWDFVQNRFRTASPIKVLGHTI